MVCQCQLKFQVVCREASHREYDGGRRVLHSISQYSCQMQKPRKGRVKHAYSAAVPHRGANSTWRVRMSRSGPRGTIGRSGPRETIRRSRHSKADDSVADQKDKGSRERGWNRSTNSPETPRWYNKAHRGFGPHLHMPVGASGCLQCCTRAPPRVEGPCIRYSDMDSNRRATKKPSQVSAGDVWRRDKKIAPEDGM
jgi:hypothetical protein